MSVRNKILGGSLSLVAITVILGILAYSYIGNISGALFGITDNNAKAVEYATGVERMALSTILEEKNYLLEEEDEIYERAKQNVAELYGFLDEVDELAAEYDNDELLKLSREAREETEAYEAKYHEAVALLVQNRETETTIVENARVIENLLKNNQEAYALVKECRVQEKNYMLRKDKASEEKLMIDFASLAVLLNEQEMTVATPADRQIIAQAKIQVQEYKKLCVDWIENVKKLQIILVDMNTMGLTVIEQAQAAENAGYAQLEVAKNEAQELSSTANMIIIASIIIAVILGVVIALFLARIITRPLLKGVDFAKTMANGDLSKRINYQSKDEIGTLANALNMMADNLSNMVAKVMQNSQMAASTAEELSASAQEVNASTEQVSSTIQEIAKGGQNLSKNAGETKEGAQQLIASIKAVAESAQDSAKNATEANEASLSGAAAAKKAGEKMGDISSAVGTSAKVVGELGEKSKEITKIVEAINSISEQTNLLALNAAIEAARAGEAGRGFAVVADEVRKLAEESQKATKQIETMISDITESTNKAVDSMQVGTKEVEEGSQTVNEALKSLELISSKVSGVADQIQEISASTQEQLANAEKVDKSINEVSAVAEESAAGSEEVSASVEETTASMTQVAESAQLLAQGAEDLKKLISQFKIDESLIQQQETKQQAKSPAVKKEEPKQKKQVKK